MKKVVILTYTKEIDSCIECRYFCIPHNNNITIDTFDLPCRCRLAQNELASVNEFYRVNSIPDWCPLPDKDGN